MRFPLGPHGLERPGAALQTQLFYLLNRHRQQLSLRQGDLFAQATVAVFPRFSVSKFWPEIERTGATMASLLGSMGIKIDKLTAEQQKYLSSWDHGT